MEHAYSTIEIKAVADESGKRLFSGIASTPSTDRMGDIVEPKGAEFTLPIPFLWQHNSREPIGWVTDAKITDAGIAIKGEVTNFDKPGKLKDRLDEAWDTMLAKLVRGLSIGFSAIETSRIEGTYSYRYLKWSWFELSAVTIPANADCSITAIKSADRALLRASLGITGKHVVRLDPRAGGTTGDLPGASGDQRRKGVVYLK